MNESLLQQTKHFMKNEAHVNNLKLDPSIEYKYHPVLNRIKCNKLGHIRVHELIYVMKDAISVVKPLALVILTVSEILE